MCSIMPSARIEKVVSPPEKLLFLLVLLQQLITFFNCTSQEMKKVCFNSRARTRKGKVSVIDSKV